MSFFSLIMAYFPATIYKVPKDFASSDGFAFAQASSSQTY